MTFFDKAQKKFNWERKIFLTSASGTTIYLYEVKNLNPFLTLYIETSLKCTINLNIKAITLKKT